MTSPASAAPPATNVDLSIIVVSWNTRELVAQCLASLRRATSVRAIEIFVVDNGSVDGTVEMLEEQGPPVIFIRNTLNVGFAAANNQAIRQAKGRFVLLLNPDTRVIADALGAMQEFLDTHPHAGAVAPQLLNADGSLQNSCEPFPTLFREFWRLFHLDRIYRLASYAPDRWASHTPVQVDVARGACLMVRREIFQAMGGLDEQFYIYSEEVDLCYRLHRAGWEIWWLSNAQVIHYGGESTRQVAGTMFLQLYKAKLQYFQKHYGLMAALVYRFILCIATLARLILTVFVVFEREPERQTHLTLARRYARLLTELAT